MSYFIDPRIFNNKDLYDSVLKKLFNIIIEAGITNFSIATQYDSTLIATNYLKRNENYYKILNLQWTRIKSEINHVFDEIGM